MKDPMTLTDAGSASFHYIQKHLRDLSIDSWIENEIGRAPVEPTIATCLWE